MKVEYESTNSGGSWWLSDNDWLALEKAGWKVDWYKDSKSKYSKPDKDGRILGALASRATRRGLDLRAAVAEWESVTGHTSTDVGCPCCGQPHYFTLYDNKGNYISSGPDASYSVEWDDG